MPIIRGSLHRKGAILINNAIIPSIIRLENCEDFIFVLITESSNNDGKIWSIVGEYLNYSIVNNDIGIGIGNNSIDNNDGDSLFFSQNMLQIDAFLNIFSSSKDSNTTTLQIPPFHTGRPLNPIIDDNNQHQICPILGMTSFLKGKTPIPIPFSLLKSRDVLKSSILKGIISSSYFEDPIKYHSFLQKIVNTFDFDEAYILSCWKEHSLLRECRMCSTKTFSLEENIMGSILIAPCIIRETSGIPTILLKGKEMIPLLVVGVGVEKGNYSSLHNSLIIIFDPIIINRKFANNTIPFIDGSNIKKISSLPRREDKISPSLSSLSPFVIVNISRETFSLHKDGPLLVRIVLSNEEIITSPIMIDKSSSSFIHSNTIQVPYSRTLLMEKGTFVVLMDDNILYNTEFKTTLKGEKYITKSSLMITFYNYCKPTLRNNSSSSSPSSSSMERMPKTIKAIIEDIYFEGVPSSTFSPHQMIGIPFEKMIIRVRKVSCGGGGGEQRDIEVCLIEIFDSPNFSFPFLLRKDFLVLFSGLKRRGIREDGTKIFEFITSSPLFEIISCFSSTSNDAVYPPLTPLTPLTPQLVPPHHYIYENIKGTTYKSIGRFIKIISTNEVIICKRCNTSSPSSCIKHLKEKIRKIKVLYSDGTGEIILWWISSSKQELNPTKYYKIYIENDQIRGEIEVIPSNQEMNLLDSL